MKASQKNNILKTWYSFELTFFMSVGWAFFLWALARRGMRDGCGWLHLHITNKHSIQ